MSSGVFTILRLGSPKGLEDIDLLRACKEHDDPTVVRSNTKGRVILRLNGCLGLVYITQPKDVVHGGMEPEPRKDV